MSSKSSLGMLIVVALIVASLWLMELNLREGDRGNGSTSNEIAIIAEIQKIKKPNKQKKRNTTSKKAKKNILDRIPTPDELYEQQFSKNQTEFELESTIPKLEVIPEELKILEEEAAIEFVSSEAVEEDIVLNEMLLEGELLPSENYKEVIPFELKQMELE